MTTRKPKESPKDFAPDKTMKHHVVHFTEETAQPSGSRWGVKSSTLARGGLDLKSLSPGKSGGAHLA